MIGEPLATLASNLAIAGGLQAAYDAGRVVEQAFRAALRSTRRAWKYEGTGFTERRSEQRACWYHTDGSCFGLCPFASEDIDKLLVDAQLDHEGDTHGKDDSGYAAGSGGPGVDRGHPGRPVRAGDASHVEPVRRDGPRGDGAVRDRNDLAPRCRPGGEALMDTSGMTLEEAKAAVEAKRLEAPTVYTFTTAYAGMVHGKEPPQIHDLMGELRRLVGSLEAKRVPGGAQFPVRDSKELIQKLAPALDKLNMLAVPFEVEPMPFEVEFTNKDGKINPGTGCTTRTTVRFIAPDGSFLDVKGIGGGLDKDDKAAGKSSTYAYKDGVLKGLTLPNKDMVDTDDESGQGTSRVKRGRSTAARTDSSAEVDIDKAPDPAPKAALTAEELIRRIETAENETILLAVAREARENLDKDGQAAAGRAYKTRKAELGIKP